MLRNPDKIAVSDPFPPEGEWGGSVVRRAAAHKPQLGPDRLITESFHDCSVFKPVETNGPSMGLHLLCVGTAHSFADTRLPIAD